MAWRQIYVMPPTDPRFLDATDYEMALDIYERQCHSLESRARSGDRDAELQIGGEDARKADDEGWKNLKKMAAPDGPLAAIAAMVAKARGPRKKPASVVEAEKKSGMSIRSKPNPKPTPKKGGSRK